MRAKWRIELAAAVVAILAVASLAAAQSAARSSRAEHSEAAARAAEARVSHHLESIRDDPSRLLEFLERMPKGGDLHNHLSGAIYAESFVNYAAEDGICVDIGALSLA